MTIYYKNQIQELKVLNKNNNTITDKTKYNIYITKYLINENQIGIFAHSEPNITDNISFSLSILKREYFTSLGYSIENTTIVKAIRDINVTDKYIAKYDNLNLTNITDLIEIVITDINIESNNKNLLSKLFKCLF